MTEGDDRTLRSVAWTEICPWLVIFRTFRPAVSLQTLLPAAVAITLTVCGWSLLAWVFSGDSDASQQARLRQLVAPPQQCPWLAMTTGVPDRPTLPNVSQWTGQLAAEAGQPQDPFFGPWSVIASPLRGVFHPDVSSASELARLALQGLWSLAVWAFFGAMIARVVAVRLACGERIGTMAALRHASSKWGSYFSAPLLPLLGVLLTALPVYALGWIMRADVGVLAAALVWPLALLAGLIMAVLLLGLLFGWPLMWATIGTEGTDSFDALSRSYSYVFQRPLHYLFYAFVAAVFGALGWLLVSNFSAAVVALTYWAAGWGAGAEQTQRVVLGSDGLEGTLYAGTWLIHFWIGCVKVLAVGFLYAYFWTATVAIYLLLRRNVDAAEMDEVFLDEDASEQPHDLAPIKTDEAGAPVVDDLPEVVPDDQDEGDDGSREPGSG